MRQQRKKAGQIGMVETVMILVVFFFIMAVGITYWQRFADRSVDQQVEEALRSRALQMGRVALTLPEIQCSGENVVQDNCVDTLKIEAMEQMMAANTDLRLMYADTFSFGRIVVQQVYPARQNFTIYPTREPQDGVTASEVMNLPVNIYDPMDQNGVCLSLKGSCNFGVMVVEAYR